MGIAAGKRDQYLALEYDAGTTPDASGHTTPDWQKRFNVWGAIESRGGSSRETWSVFRMFATCSHVITIPYTTQAITTLDRFRLGSRLFNIAGPPVNYDQKNVDYLVPVTEEP